MIRKPYLLFLGDAPDALAAKVARGIRDWRPDAAVGQYRMEGCNADVDLPDMSVREAREAGANTLVIGVANRGGTISDAWKSVLAEALGAGLDVASGLHNLLRDEADLVALRRAERLRTARRAGPDRPVPDRQWKTSPRPALSRCRDGCFGRQDVHGSRHGQGDAAPRPEIDLSRNWPDGDPDRGREAYRSTRSSRTSCRGSVEHLSPDNDDDHWDMIEGQGSLFHASYSGVTMALVHGGQPDALVLCHDPTREHMRGLPGYRLPDLAELRDLALTLARVVNPDCRVCAVSVNIRELSERDAADCLAKIEDSMGLPAVDPFRYGAGRLVDALPE